jgi:hypothetical protein
MASNGIDESARSATPAQPVAWLTIRRASAEDVKERELYASLDRNSTRRRGSMFGSRQSTSWARASRCGRSSSARADVDRAGARRRRSSGCAVKHSMRHLADSAFTRKPVPAVRHHCVGTISADGALRSSCGLRCHITSRRPAVQPDARGGSIVSSGVPRGR